MNLNELLFDVLNYTDGECVSINTQAPGGDFRSAVVPVAQAAELVAAVGDSANVWHGVNPISKRETGRGTALDVTRLAAVWADLDVKDSGCGSEENAHAIIADLAGILGTLPTAVVSTGGGLHPYWAIEDGAIADTESRFRASSALRRFGALVKRVAATHNGMVDSVFDLPRVLRSPGTLNLKDPANPRPAVGELTGGAPLTIGELEERLDEAGIEAETVATPKAGAQSAPSEWVWAPEACEYAVTAIKGWGSDIPKAGRHQWLLSQMTRLTTMHRRGCLTAEAFDAGYRAIRDRFGVLCADGIGGDVREVPSNEVTDALQFAESKTAAMDAADLDAELGAHLHIAELAGGVPIQMAPPPHRDPVQPHTAPAQSDFFGDEDDGECDGDWSGLVSGDVDNVAGGDAEGRFTLTDSGAADLVVERHRDALRYCPGMGKWLSRTGAVWDVRPDDSEAFQAARETIDGIQTGGVTAVARFKTKSLAANKLAAMVGLARRQREMHVSVDELDPDPYALATPDGVIDLRTGEIVPTDGLFHTRCTGVGYDLGGVHPTFTGFLNQTFAGDVEMVAYIQRLAGLAAIGEIREQILPFPHGSGRNGKGVLLDVLQGVFGTYATTAPLGFLVAGPQQHPTEIARLRGARLVVTSEANRTDKFDEAKVKWLTGPDGKLTGRQMGKEFFDFTASHTIFLPANHLPSVEAGGPSFWDRLRLIPFEHYVPPHLRIPNLAALIVETEGPAVLGWVVQGALNYLRHGLADPPSVLAATAEYAKSEDAIGRFVEECLVVGLGATEMVKSNVIMSTYVRWCRENGETPLTENKLGRELSSRFKLGTHRTGQGRFRTGVAMNPNAPTANFLMDGFA